MRREALLAWKNWRRSYLLLYWEEEGSKLLWPAQIWWGQAEKRINKANYTWYKNKGNHHTDTKGNWPKLDFSDRDYWDVYDKQNPLNKKKKEKLSFDSRKTSTSHSLARHRPDLFCGVIQIQIVKSQLYRCFMWDQHARREREGGREMPIHGWSSMACMHCYTPILSFISLCLFLSYSYSGT